MEDTNLQLASQSRGALDDALTRVGDRWSLLVVDGLLDGPRRFNELQETLPDIATNVLAQRLRRLESEGVVIATPYSRRPVRYVYELTGAGHELGDTLRLLARWGVEHPVPGDQAEAVAPSHGACGSTLETRWYCPTCDRVVADDEIGERGGTVYV